jgi:calcium-translocating P-type ATPase
MMITVVLSSNMGRMLRDNVLVRKLFGIETAGSLNVLFTDKTGTLTRGKLSACAFVDAEGKTYDLDALKKRKPLWKLAYVSMAYNNASEMTGGGLARRAIGGNATDRALLEAIDGQGSDLRTLRAEGGIPFDSAHKYATMKVRGEINATLIKGAPEVILGCCTRYSTPNGGEAPFGGRQRAAVEKTSKALAGQAVRLIALAVSDKDIKPGQLPGDMTLVALVGLRDEVRPEAIRGVREAQSAGVQVVMITGDSKDTAVAIAVETGILGDPNQLAITSQELRGMSDRDLLEALPCLRVVARALPTDKSRLVKAAQALGLVAGMTGDGINDAPALKLADVGFAMGSGTEVAKEAGDIVIMDDNIASIGNAILYGRTIFKSIRKFIIFQLTINLCAVSLAVLGPFIGIETPITVLQMLWINMVMDTLAGLAFSGEPPLRDYMAEPPKRRDAPILNRYMVGQILFTGIYSMLLCLVFLATEGFGVIRSAADGRYLLTAFFGLFMFMAIFNAFNARTHRLNLLNHLAKNKLFIAVMGLIAVIQMLMLYIGGELFRTAPLSPQEMALIMMLAVSVLPIDCLRKAYLRWRKIKENGV